MQDLIRKFKKRILNGETVIGPFMKSGDPAFVEAAGYAGFDFAILDREHGPVTIENMQNNVRAAVISGMLPIIRVEDSRESSIGKALDIGAGGIQVPQISTAAQAENVVNRARFYPEGERGVCRFVRAANYSAKDRGKYFKEANETLIILQLEGTEALENIKEIIEVPGVDILFIGPYDLSQSLGVPGEIGSPVVVEKMQYLVDRARRKEVVVGTFVDRPEDVRKWTGAGVQYISYSVDLGIFLEACREIVGLNKF